MKAWTSATIDGRCASDHAHAWKKGARIVLVRGSAKDLLYCGTCGIRIFGMPAADTGEVHDVTDAKGFPSALKPHLEQTPERFDARAAAAGPDSD